MNLGGNSAIHSHCKLPQLKVRNGKFRLRNLRKLLSHDLFLHFQLLEICAVLSHSLNLVSTGLDNISISFDDAKIICRISITCEMVLHLSSCHLCCIKDELTVSQTLISQCVSPDPGTDRIEDCLGFHPLHTGVPVDFLPVTSIDLNTGVNLSHNIFCSPSL